jgi:glycosyltransferase involved in cell wall biosynthesis
MYKKPTRLFVDAHVFDGEHQGSRTFIRELYRRLARKHDLEIVLAAHDTRRLEDAFGRQPNLTFVPYRTTTRIKRLGFEIPALIRQYASDFAHFQYVAAPLKQTRYVVTTHDLLFKDYPAEFPLSYRVSKAALFRTSLRLANVVTTVSEYSRDAIHRHFGIPKARIHVTPNGVSDEFSADYDAQAVREFVLQHFGIQNHILYVSRIEPRKQQAVLLQAYLTERLYDYGIQVVFVGHESIPDPELEALRTNLPAEARPLVHFRTGIPDVDLLRLYQAARLFVYPSLAEGFGIPPLEAGALGVPTLCSDATAMHEFTFFGAGHFTPTLENLRRHLRQFFLEGHGPTPDELQRIARHIRSTYSWERSAEVLYQLITNEN